jgi:hypothetical protein
MEDYSFFSEELEESLMRFLAFRHPNPERIGCPDSSILRDIAFHRKIAPETVRKVTAHMWKCSECVRDALDFVEEYRKTTE